MITSFPWFAMRGERPAAGCRRFFRSSAKAFGAWWASRSRINEGDGIGVKTFYKPTNPPLRPRFLRIPSTEVATIALPLGRSAAQCSAVHPAALPTLHSPRLRSRARKMAPRAPHLSSREKPGPRRCCGRRQDCTNLRDDSQATSYRHGSGILVGCGGRRPGVKRARSFGMQAPGG